MAFDGLVMAAVKKELKERIIGGRIEKIYQPLPEEIVLIIHKDKRKFRLLASAHARDARIHLTGNSRENPLTPPLFCMVLRKHLEGGKIININQHGLERVLAIRVEAIDELGILSEKKLVCEVMGKHSNIVLVDPSTNVILDGIKRYSYATSRHREILPGRKYIPPPETGRISPLEATEEAFRQALWDPDQDLPLESILLLKFEGFSPQTCREIAVRAGMDPGTGNQSLGDIDLRHLWESFRNIRDSAISGRFEPCICYDGSRPIAFSAIFLYQFSQYRCRQGQMNDILDDFFSTREIQERFKRSVSELMKIANNEIKRAQKKIALHQQALRKAENTQDLRISGELLTANIFQIPAGASAIELVNYYDPEGKTVVIPLDPQLSPAENAQLYFKRYNKARKSLEVSENYLREAKAELDYWESVILAVNQAENENDLLQIRDELIKEGYIQRPPMPKKPGRPGPAPDPTFITFKSKEGFDILVGRNNRQNDHLTMKIARSEDLWLHVKDIPGSHVIIKNPGGSEVPAQTLQRAAEIAAFYSKARESSKVPVDYTLRKHVRKPQGAKPGMVVYDNQKTIMVEPKI